MELYHQRLLDFISNTLVIPPSDEAAIRQYFEPVFMPKGTLAHSPGKIPGYHNFIVSGYMRSFHLDIDNKEITTDLNNGPRFFTSYAHFMNRTVSHETIHCITDCEVLRISRANVELRAEASSTLKDYTIRILQKRLAEEKERISDLANLTAEQRYLKFMKEKPNTARHVPLSYIASYLGITQRHLSRLRKEVSV
ncbi:Crp/Fnr family transcriptional regulator [Salmonirosea aquatica]|uniref:Crp/Fnr family transcriptional regulator n=1 Tax=Salmonirosea aquatica TaxID=2654236 RepID=A0A7C9FQK7_9BACT|nr:Crp/Fnr family transcriptional regulator [Cytophagaceae bacterium SJW1-29]